jgi:hypothetical protein
MINIFFLFYIILLLFYFFFTPFQFRLFGNFCCMSRRYERLENKQELSSSNQGKKGQKKANTQPFQGKSTQQVQWNRLQCTPKC